MASAEPDDDVDEAPFRAPLPKADRLWRHPSELDDRPHRPAWWPFRRPAAEDDESGRA